MSSILDGYDLPPIVVPQDKTSQYIIIAIILIVILASWIWTSHTLANSVSSSVLFLECAMGQCPTNIYNGEKRCSQDPLQAMLYDPSFEVCNSRYTCENPKTPYALYSDGSTHNSGVCESGNACRCLKAPQCGNHALVLFEMQNGSAYINESTGSRYILQQSVINDPSYIGVRNLQYTNRNTQFCTINAYDTNRISPGACSFTGIPSPTDMLTCTYQNPCSIGALAYITNQEPSKFLATRDANYYPLACVPGVPCPETLYPIWDPKVGQIACILGK